jgi:nitroimidazol reductase NimA-like FMN-containing flavoprotein (pyridoxamine 5'-phosphate oxidase superfamily)
MTTDYDVWDMPGAGHSHEAIEPEECWALLSTGLTGRIGVLRDGRVFIFPVNYVVHDRGVYFRTSSTGDLGRTSLDRVAFQVDHVAAEQMSGWSVLVQGSTAVVTDEALLSAVWGRMVSEPWAGGDRRQLVQVVPTSVSGRRVGTVR